MARNSITNTVLEASRVLLSHTIKLHGVNTYIISSDFISWDATHSYKISDIAVNFGTRVTPSQSAVIGSRDTGFACGNGDISAFDFGLLYTAFTAMVMAKIELGTNFPVFSDNTSKQGIRAIWFGNDAIIYSTEYNLIIPVKNADIETACGGHRVQVNNFCSKDTYVLDRENKMFYFTRPTGELFFTINIPECVVKTYFTHFKGSSSGDTGVVNVGWEEDSPLGALIDKTDTRSECMSILEKYKLSPPIASIVSRDDLVVDLTDKYVDTSNFFGSVCYTDKHEIVIAVNFHRGLFVYYPWFKSAAGQEDDIKVDPSAKFPEFYNVTEGCNRILRYVGTVVNRPFTSAQMDSNVFNLIKESFLNMKLARVPIQAAFGRIVIPEEILLNELIGGVGESLFCIVPVGIVGQNLVCITSENVVTAVTPSGWDLSSAFYDITEVIK